MAEASRSERKRQRTRSLLVAAARKLGYRSGNGKISIQEITEEADVGLGTFYNYFETKQDIFRAVLQEVTDQFNADLEALQGPLKDPAMNMAATLKFIFYEFLETQEWMLFLPHADTSKTAVLRQKPECALRDLQRGIQAGRFKVDDVDFTHNLIQGMIDHVNAEIQRGRLGGSAIEETTRYILRMLGLPDVVAKALAQAPLPALPERERSESLLQAAV